MSAPFEYVEQLIRPARLIFHLVVLPWRHAFLLLGVVRALGSRDRVGALEPAIEVDILAAPGTERPKALGRGFAANGAGLCRVRRFAHPVQITPRPQLSKR